MSTKHSTAMLSLCAGLAFLLLWTFTTLAGPAHAQGPGQNWAGATKKEVLGSRSGKPPAPAGPHIADISLGNGDFESGSDGSWTEYSALGWPLIVISTTLPSGVTPHSGDWAVWLGGDNGETAYISQTVTVPANHPILSFWEWIASAETDCTHDFGSVRISEDEVTSFPLCASANTGHWVESTLDLGAYAGQTVQLQIGATTNGSINSNLFIDDVALESFSHSVYLPILGNNACASYDYFDGFGNPNSGWYPGVDGDVTREYLNGEYRILFNNFNLSWYVTPDLVMPANYRVEADMRNAGNNPGTYGLKFGVHWFYNSAAGEWQVDQAYQVLLNPNPDFQKYLIEKVANEDWTTLRGWTYSAAIRTGPATNHLRVDRVGTAIRVYINGTSMPALTDTSFTGSGRDAGIVAYSYDSYPVDMRFDNFHASGCPQ